jgi:hypothetical protein
MESFFLKEVLLPGKSTFLFAEKCTSLFTIYNYWRSACFKSIALNFVDNKKGGF